MLQYRESPPLFSNSRWKIENKSKLKLIYLFFNKRNNATLIIGIIGIKFLSNLLYYIILILLLKL